MELSQKIIKSTLLKLRIITFQPDKKAAKKIQSPLPLTNKLNPIKYKYLLII
jgi:hypothetical protein